VSNISSQMKSDLQAKGSNTRTRLELPSLQSSSKPKVIVIIPAFNEENRIGAVIRRIPNGLVDHVIVVDDHSNDSTVMESLQAGAFPIRNHDRHGSGHAKKVGYREGLRRGGEILVTLDADLQHDPTEIPKLLSALEDNQTDYVAGDRLGGEPLHHGMPLSRYAGNVLLTWLSRAMIGVKVGDSQCGFTAIKRAALEKVDIESLSDSWGFTNDLLAECKRRHLRVRSVPVSTHYGSRRSYIHLHEYIPRMIFVLVKAFIHCRMAFGE
jgi:glycosyltransferase involved in cell wall biosynthesis